MTPDPFAAALTADATSVPCAPVIVARPVQDLRLRGEVRQRRVDEVVDDADRDAGHRRRHRRSDDRAPSPPGRRRVGDALAMERDVGLGVDEVVPAAERGGEAARAVAGDGERALEAERAGAEAPGDLRDVRARPGADEPPPGSTDAARAPRPGASSAGPRTSVPSARTPASRTPRIRPRQPPVRSACAPRLLPQIRPQGRATLDTFQTARPRSRRSANTGGRGRYDGRRPDDAAPGARSSVDRALASGARGHRFESCRAR